MTDIAKAVELAKKWVRACEWTGNADSSSAEIARALLAVMPVVEAAKALSINWRDTSGSLVRVDAIHEGLETLARAIDALDKAGAK